MVSSLKKCLQSFQDTRQDVDIIGSGKAGLGGRGRIATLLFKYELAEPTPVTHQFTAWRLIRKLMRIYYLGMDAGFLRELNAFE